MRAGSHPDGFVDRGGVRIFFEVYGEDGPTVFLLMPSTIAHSGAWKGKVPFLARSSRVVVIDPRGNGRSDSPSIPEDFSDRHFVDDAWAVLDEIEVEQTVWWACAAGAALRLRRGAGQRGRVGEGEPPLRRRRHLPEGDLPSRVRRTTVNRPSAGEGSPS